MIYERESVLFDEVADVLGALPGVQVAKTSMPLGNGNAGAEAVIDLTTPSGRSTYAVVARLNVTRSTLEAVIAQLQRLEGLGGIQPLLATAYLPDALADALAESGLNFVDTAGNMSLRGSGLYAVVRGKKPRDPSTHDAFAVTGLRIVYALMAYPQLRRATYRDIQNATGVGLGSVSRTVSGLLEQGYLLKGRDGALHVAQFRDLLSRWELGYLETLRPKLAPTAWRYSSGDRQRALETLRQGPGVLVGGEEAAARLTRYLKPQTLTLHADQTAQKELRTALKLLPAKGVTDVYLLGLPVPDDLARARADHLASPLLVRAELLAYGGDRLREVANKLLDTIEKPSSDDR